MPWMKQGFSQADTRGQRILFDQHGRQWFTNFELRSGHPTGPITPQFTAPWYPDSQYFGFPKLKPNDLVIDYDAMAGVLARRHAEYHQLIERAGVHFLGQGYDAAKPPPAQVLNDVGRPPFPIEVILAAKAGNGYVLGSRAFNPEHKGDAIVKRALDEFNKPNQVIHIDEALFADLPPELGDTLLTA